MAYRPSYRRTKLQVEDVEPNMTPIMNLMVVLIPLLLTSAQLIKISVIELNLPPAAGPQITEEQPEEKELKLDLAVSITDQGFFISSSHAVLRSEEGPSIPKVNGEYNYDLLGEKLYEIKQKALNEYADNNTIMIQAEPQVDYQTLVSTMDAARAIRKEDRLVSLFPQVSISALIM